MRLTFLAVAVALPLLMFTCTRQVAGTNDETVTGTAKVYGPDHLPASGVLVKAFAHDDTSGVPLAQAFTQEDGSYSLKLKYFLRYNIWSEVDSLVAFQGSVFADYNLLPLDDDTLRPARDVVGTLAADSVALLMSTTVRVMGSDRQSSVDSAGAFTLRRMTSGKYTLRVAAKEPVYAPTVAPIEVSRAQLDTAVRSIVMNAPIPVTYTGTQAIKGLSATVDSLNGIVTLRWNRIVNANLLDYGISRNLYSQSEPTSFHAVVRDTVYVDTIPRDLRDSLSGITYWVSVRGKDSVKISGSSASVNLSLPLNPASWFAIQGPDTAFWGDSVTLTISHFSYVDSGWSFRWNVNNGDLATMATAPSIAFALSDSSVPFNYNEVVAYGPRDTFYMSRVITTAIAWEFVSAVSTGNGSPTDAIVHNDEIWVLWTDSSLDSSNLMKYSESLGILNEVALPFAPKSRFAPLGGRVYLSDNRSTLWHSADGRTWTHDSLYRIGGPVPFTRYPIVLCGTGAMLYALQDSGGLRKAAKSVDGYFWDSAGLPPIRIEPGDYAFEYVEKLGHGVFQNSTGASCLTNDFVDFWTGDSNSSIWASPAPSLMEVKDWLFVTDTLGSNAVGLRVGDYYGSNWQPMHNQRFSGPDFGSGSCSNRYRAVAYRGRIYLITCEGIYRSKR